MVALTCFECARGNILFDFSLFVFDFGLIDNAFNKTIFISWAFITVSAVAVVTGSGNMSGEFNLLDGLLFVAGSVVVFFFDKILKLCFEMICS